MDEPLIIRLDETDETPEESREKAINEVLALYDDRNLESRALGYLWRVKPRLYRRLKKRGREEYARQKAEETKALVRHMLEAMPSAQAVHNMAITVWELATRRVICEDEKVDTW